MKTLKAFGEKGFSLVEVMIVVSMTSLIAYCIFISMRTGDLQMRTAELRMSIEDSAREGLYKMTQEIRTSAPTPDRIQIGNPNNSITFQVPNPTANILNSDFTVNWDNAQTIRYALGNCMTRYGENGLTSCQIIRTNQTTGTSAVVASDVSQLSFSLTGHIMTITMGVQRTLYDGRIVPATPLMVTSEFHVRNDDAGEYPDNGDETGNVNDQNHHHGTSKHHHHHWG